jgi:penicillin amidase
VTPPPFGVPLARLKDLENWPLFTVQEMPHVLNPARGFVASANNRQWPPEAAYHGGRAHTPGFRAFRIEELLGQTKKHDLESIRATQCDVQSVDARFILPPLLKLTTGPLGAEPLEENALRALELLGTWDYQARIDCRACSVYRRWLDHLYELRGLNATALFHLLRQNPQPADLMKSARMALRNALADLRVDAQGSLLSFPAWGDIHRNGFQHLSMHHLFDVMSVPTPGDDNSVNPGTTQWRGRRYEHTQGASHRLIVEMTSPPTVHAVLAGSNLDVESPRLEDSSGPWMKWVNCEQERKLFPLDWAKLKKEQASAVSVVHLGVEMK